MMLLSTRLSAGLTHAFRKVIQRGWSQRFYRFPTLRQTAASISRGRAWFNSESHHDIRSQRAFSIMPMLAVRIAT
jgi:hypothetical protein